MSTYGTCSPRILAHSKSERDNLPPACIAKPLSIHLPHVAHPNDADGNIVHIRNLHAVKSPLEALSVSLMGIVLKHL